MKYDEFAKRAGRRLEEAADRLEGKVRGLGIDGETSDAIARAGELRVAALLVREEAAAVSEAEERGTATEKIAENPPLEAQG